MTILDQQTDAKIAEIRKDYYSSERSWNRGFRAGMLAGYAAAILTLGAGVAFVMWLERLS